MGRQELLPVAALVIYVVYLIAAFGVRSWLHYRATGDTGMRGVSGRVGSPEWLAGILFVVAVLVGIAGPVAGLLGLAPIGLLDHLEVAAAGLAWALAGVVYTVVAQRDMGASWRVGVDDSETTDLVTGGLFRWSRNPIFTAMMMAATGLALIVPNVVSLVGLVALIAAIHLQVQVVEEPYLLREHGQDYRSYAARVGRFLPWFGRLR